MRSSSTSLRSLVMPYRLPDQQNAQQKFRIDRRSTQVTVALLQTFPHKIETNVLVDEPQQMIFRNVIFQTEVVEQRLTTGLVSHHDQQASNHRNPAKHASF